MAKTKREIELETRLAELEANIIEETAPVVDPKILEAAKRGLNFDVIVAKLVLEVIGYEATLEEKLAIEKRILDNKVEKMSAASSRETVANW